MNAKRPSHSKTKKKPERKPSLWDTPDTLSAPPDAPDSPATPEPAAPSSLSPPPSSPSPAPSAPNPLATDSRKSKPSRPPAKPTVQTAPPASSEASTPKGPSRNSNIRPRSHDPNHNQTPDNDPHPYAPSGASPSDALADAIGSVDNAPSLGLHHQGLSIDGYSRAAVQTYWRIAELKIGFDLGAQPWDFMALPRYFITHSHLDHIAALPSYVARRRMMKMEQPTIYLADHSLATVDQLLRVFSRLDRGRLPCKLVPITPNQEIEISRELVVTTSAMRHSIPALGFIVWERRKKLKPEFAHLTGDQIRDIKLSGTDVTHEVRIPLVAYTGDTSPAGLDDCPDMYRAKILITEMTFVAPEHRRDRIHKHGHMHLDDFVDRQNDFQNELVICGHFSVRYNEQQIRRWVDRALPDRLDGRLKLWL